MRLRVGFVVLLSLLAPALAMAEPPPSATPADPARAARREASIEACRDKHPGDRCTIQLDDESALDSVCVGQGERLHCALPHRGGGRHRGERGSRPAAAPSPSP